MLNYISKSHLYIFCEIVQNRMFFPNGFAKDWARDVTLCNGTSSLCDILKVHIVFNTLGTACPVALHHILEDLPYFLADKMHCDFFR